MRSSAIANHDAQRMHAIEVPAASWPDVLAEIKPSLVVMDIEGGELDLLDSPHLNGSVERMLIELHPHRYGDAAAERMGTNLKRSGFTVLERNGRVLALMRE
jgi:hypothetical protein